MGDWETIVQGAQMQPLCGGRNFERRAKPLKSRREHGGNTLILRFSYFWALIKSGSSFVPKCP